MLVGGGGGGGVGGGGGGQFPRNVSWLIEKEVRLTFFPKQSSHGSVRQNTDLVSEAQRQNGQWLGHFLDYK